MILGKQTKYLIEASREDSENQDVSESIGIPDSAFIRHLNDAQDRIFALIINKYPSIFTKNIEIPLVRGQKEVPLPSDTYIGNKITDVKYLETNTPNWYGRVLPSNIKRDVGTYVGIPREYYRDSGKLYLLPPCDSSSGALRLNYVYRIPRLDLQRAVVSSVVLDNSTKQITSLFFDVTNNEIDLDALERNNRFTVVNDDGLVQMSSIKYTNINTSTGEVTIAPGFTFTEGQTINVGDVVCAGPLSSTHSYLDEYVERYLVAYCTMKILQREGSAEQPTQSGVLQAMEAEIVDSYSDVTDDITEIPEIISPDESWN